MSAFSRDFWQSNLQLNFANVIYNYSHMYDTFSSSNHLPLLVYIKYHLLTTLSPPQLILSTCLSLVLIMDLIMFYGVGVRVIIFQHSYLIIGSPIPSWLIVQNLVHKITMRSLWQINLFDFFFSCGRFNQI